MSSLDFMSNPFASFTELIKDKTFLQLLYSKFTENSEKHLLLMYDAETINEVELFQNVVYRFYNQGKPDAYCVLSDLKFHYGPSIIPGSAQLLIIEYQKRGLPHVHSSNVTVLNEVKLTIDEVKNQAN